MRCGGYLHRGVRTPALPRSLLLPLAIAALLVVLGCDVAARTQAAPAASGLDLKLVRIAAGFNAPVQATAPRSQPGRVYVVEQPGRIRVIQNGHTLSKPFLDIRRLVKSGGEQGLLSVAFHPDFASNGLFYVDYTDLNGNTRVIEYRARAGKTPLRKRQLLRVEQPYANHNGGQLAFGPDGRLYVGMGDGGSAGDPQNRAQNLQSRLGKILAIDVGRAGADWEITGYGLRNPWRFSFDRKTDDLYIGDVGEGDWEEIDVTSTPGQGLENYGWNVFEGTHRYRDGTPNGAGSLVDPVYEYSHADGCSVTGGFVYRGSKIPAAQGRYFFGDYCSGTIWSFSLQGDQAKDVRTHSFTVDQISSFGENAAGELLLVSQANGAIYRLSPG